MQVTDPSVPPLFISAHSRGSIHTDNAWKNVRNELAKKYYDVTDATLADGPVPIATPVFDGATQVDVDETLLGWMVAQEDRLQRWRDRFPSFGSIVTTTMGERYWAR